MANALAVSLKALGATTTSGTGTALDLFTGYAADATGPLRRALQLSLDVRALSGAGALLKVEIEASPDNATWAVIHTRDGISRAEVVEFVVGGALRYVRAKWTLSGTSPSFTWSLTGHAHVVYCEPKDISSDAVPSDALEGISDEDRWAACITQSDTADGYIGGAYELPLKAWGGDLRSKTAALVAAQLFRRRGCDPEGPDKLVFDTEATALKWFDRLADGRLSPPGIVDSTAETFEGGSVVVSGTSRGW